MKKNYFSSHKLPKQQSTNFWSQGILGVKSYGVLKISPTLRAGSQPLSMQQFLPKTAQICL
jgi:hypothetical protein